MKKVKAIFDIGKTNKKFLLFDKDNELVYEEEKIFELITDDDEFECEDIESLKNWIFTTINSAIASKKYDITDLNFTTYGATLVYLDENGERVTPVYNYLKKVDETIFEEFYEKYEGREEFCRKTASPALGMLNSGLQIYWLKHKKSEYWKKVEHILHFPQYLSFLFTGKIVSEYTSIGCHTGMWNYDDMKYHDWLDKEGVNLPEPVANSTKYKVEIQGKSIGVGIGIHDSSASLVPFLKQLDSKFILISSGTWAINLNPFNDSNLTAEQLNNDCLCYLSVNQKQVKSSRLFMGHIHDENVNLMNEFYNVRENGYKNVKTRPQLIKQIFGSQNLVFFKNGIPQNYKIDSKLLERFDSFSEAYHQLMFELSLFETEQIERIIADRQQLDNIYIAGGFTNNDLFVKYMALFFDDMDIELSNIDNGTALGAAMILDN